MLRVTGVDLRGVSNRRLSPGFHLGVFPRLIMSRLTWTDDKITRRSHIWEGVGSRLLRLDRWEKVKIYFFQTEVLAWPQHNYYATPAPEVISTIPVHIEMGDFLALIDICFREQRLDHWTLFRHLTANPRKLQKWWVLSQSDWTRSNNWKQFFKYKYLLFDQIQFLCCTGLEKSRCTKKWPNSSRLWIKRFGLQWSLLKCNSNITLKYFL